MKTVKEILEQRDHLSAFDKRVDNSNTRDLPAVIILKRKAIRVFPDNQKIGLYYSQALDKYISIPYSEDGKALGMHISEQEEKNETPMETRLVSESFRSKLKLVREEQLDEVAPLVAGAARLAAPVIGRGLAAGGRAALSLGKRAVRSFMKKKDPTGPMKKYDKRFSRTQKAKDAVGRGVSKVGRGARRVGKRIAAVGGALAKGAAEANNIEYKQDSQSNHQFRGNLAQISTNTSISGRPPNAKENEWTQRGYSIPIGSRPQSMNESNLSLIRTVAKTKISESVVFGEREVTVTPRIAKKVLTVYESLNKQNKKKFERMLNEDAESFRKALNFVIKA